ncbi:MAG: LacI family DNA-binding transcriptional regulator [Treponema sp.]|nr:LacI family transcriptional regulator [Spirochaetia bacterium]MDD7460189.1 LacI family DNA-binding transcriptional regulator [Spirochaetales bacterium]MDY5810740.1 LacI family DNA-binding transcriptional regulator [Treponema sp.]
MTIKDIAKECGCAIGTVSRVLNNHPDVSNKTRERVLAVVKKYNFVLNANAKSLKSQERKNIIVVVKGSSSPLLNSLLECLQKKLELLPYTVSVVVLDENDDEVKNAVRLYYEQKPAGFIFLGGLAEKYTEDFNRVKVPCVLITTSAASINNEFLSSISIDDEKAAYFVTDHLIKMGHKKIGVIGGKMDSEVTCARYKGFLKAMEENSLPFDFESSYEVSRYSMESGFTATEKLIKKNKDFTAIFTMSDVMAIGTIRKLTELGFKVPDDISVTGFDGLSLGEFYCPRLSTVRQNEEEMIEKGLAVFLGSVEKSEKSVHLYVPFEFVEGESIKKL